MRDVHRKHGIDRFNFVDDNFLNHPRDVEEFISILKETPVSFKWRFQARIDRIEPSFIEKLAEVGLYDVSIGIESGSQKMLDTYQKRIDIGKAFEKLDAIRQLIDVHATFIVGGPGENWETVRQTEAFIRKLRLKNSAVGILTLFPKTYFYRQALRDGIIRDENEYCLNLGPVFDRTYTNISDLSDTELIQARNILQDAASEFGSYS